MGVMAAINDYCLLICDQTKFDRDMVYLPTSPTLSLIVLGQ